MCGAWNAECEGSAATRGESQVEMLHDQGRKGPITAEFAFLRATSKRGRRPGDEVWVVFRRGLEPGGEIKYYLSNAPPHCPRTTLSADEWVAVAGRDRAGRRQE